MPIPSTDVNVVEITMQGVMASGGSNTINTAFVFHYLRNSTVPAISKANVETEFEAGPVVALLAALNNRYTQTQNLVRWLNDAQDLFQSFTRTGVGAVTGDSMPSDNAIYMLLRTALRGQSYRGSKHFGPASESDSVDDILAGAGVTNWAAVATALEAPLVDSDGNTWNLCVVSRKLSQLVTNPTTVVANQVADVLLNKRVGTMKKRKAKSVY